MDLLITTHLRAGLKKRTLSPSINGFTGRINNIMCELMGMSANVPTDICFSFKGLRERRGRTGPHKDGWGVAFYSIKGNIDFSEHTTINDVVTVVATEPLTNNEQ
ncbi:hypothetical protein GCM10011357_05550 [Lacimicrobium alkaliphilum]|uniref:Uncharacterized protein n=1 Tax=Lacimicrobium alkaliphilum TaxID=1526571 RepID=A0ABQ1R2E3_9ALTE|nr:hypothetical protein GCM10011357_05550 [Lacimicrobium alkaliphilum]